MSNQAEPQTRLSIAAQFPEHYFLENIAVRPDDSMPITVEQPKAAVLRSTFAQAKQFFSDRAIAEMLDGVGA